MAVKVEFYFHSKHFPKVLRFVSRENEKPDYGEATERKLYGIYHSAWMLLQTREKARYLKGRHEVYRTRILAVLPPGLWRVIVGGKNGPLEVTISPNTTKEIKGRENIAAFIEHVGPHADLLVKELRLPFWHRLLMPNKFDWLASAVGSIVEESEAFEHVTLSIDTKLMDKLVKAKAFKPFDGYTVTTDEKPTLNVKKV